MARKRMLDGKVAYNSKSKITKMVPKFKMYKQLYNQSYSFTRDVVWQLQYNANSPGGFVNGVSNYPALTIVYGNGTTNIYFSSINFLSVSMPNYAEIAALWDLIRIDKVELSMYNNHTRTGDNSTANGSQPLLIANDPNSSQGATDLTTIQQMRNKLIEPDRKIEKWTCYPKPQSIVYYTGATSTYAPQTMFVNSDTDTPHFATKIAWTNPLQLNSTGHMTFTAKYFFTCKTTK